ncbi:MAG TPA: CvpA family protein [Candidatus Limnocylindrales bacterium]|nr:CvpA family protein [Candidatus Limnocylindrales bacterium]
MNIGEVLGSINRFDLLFILFVFGMFVLGFAQGTIRRVLGIASMLFSFLFAANLRGPFGGYLAQNWNDFPDEYAVMLGFGIVFVAATIAFTAIIQGFYHKQALFQKNTFVDEIIGGILGVVQAFLFVGFVIIILDSFFHDPAIPKSDNEFGWIRDLYNMTATDSVVGDLFRTRLIPGFVTIFGLLIPTDIRAIYVSVNVS